jgi:glucose-6-phosphate isomerase
MFNIIVENCFKEVLTSRGVSRDIYNKYLVKTQKILPLLKNASIPVLNLEDKEDDLKEINQIAQHIRNNFTKTIILGTGGSSLNGQSLVGLKPDKNLIFLDNIDPHSFDQIINNIDFDSTAFLVISKSGKTPETIAQLLAIINKFDINSTSGKNFFFITSNDNNPIRHIATTIKAASIINHDNIGGRFASFTSVGLLPAAIAGLSPANFCLGAKQLINDHLSNDNSDSIKCAAVKLALLEEGYTSNVLMPYIDRLANFAKWYRQIWAESLAKGGKGSTLIDAMGTIDQHSQLQLYLDGPKDKLVTLITTNNNSQGAPIKANFAIDDSLSYLLNKTLGDLIDAESKATAQSLIKNNVPLITIEISDLNEQALGALMMHSILETIITANVINVNPFDQPAVEEGKLMAQKILLNE